MRRAYIPTDNRKDRRKGRFLSFMLHAGIILMAIWPFMQPLPEEKTAEIQVIMVDFREQTSGSQREGASASSKSGLETFVEETIPEEELVEEQVEDPLPEPEPIPEPEPQIQEVPDINPTPQPELMTTTAPEPIKIPPVPPQPEPEPIPEPEVVEAPPIERPPVREPEPEPVPEPEPEPEPQPKPEKPKSAIEQIRDFFSKPENNPTKGRNGNSGEGTGDKEDGKETNDGSSDSGNSGSGDKGDGDSDSGNRANGAGEGFIEGMGRLSRDIMSKPSISSLIKKEGTIVVKVCINRRGSVIYAEFDNENSTIKDSDHKKRAVDHVQKVVFKANNNAPDRECGRLYYSLSKQGFKEGQ
ncbi:MAG: hypothetical protein KJP00_14195 [Bacteroidia bacterium]|nr:hypothetical protein [Bacteroidia bacterium]